MERTGDQIRLAAVILAAGRSQRMGRAKMLLPLQGGTLLGQIVQTYLQILPASQIVLVTGFESDQIAASVAQFNVKTVFNPDFASGEMLSSVKVGIRAAEAVCDDCFLVLGDQPFVQASTLRTLVASHRERQASVSRLCYHGKHGHPLLFASKGFQSILDLTQSQTLKDFVEQQAVNDVVTDDAAVTVDMDTPSDYQRLLQQIRSESCCPVEAS